MITIPNNFDGSKFIEKFNLSVEDFRVVGGRLDCPSLQNLTSEDIADCVVDEWANVRKVRNKLLSECDWTQLPDSPLSESEKTAWQTYRTALRDIPQTSGSPSSVVWPDMPA